uniref:Secreted protein n=1 Tax=Anguilla anguilla TaxID=7936 RepID=A0A0E9XGF8_ANGAN
MLLKLTVCTWPHFIFVSFRVQCAEVQGQSNKNCVTVTILTDCSVYDCFDIMLSFFIVCRSRSDAACESGFYF